MKFSQRGASELQMEILSRYLWRRTTSKGTVFIAFFLLKSKLLFSTVTSTQKWKSAGHQRISANISYVHNATFIDNSKFTRSGKFRLGVMVIDQLGERVEEGITEPFTVKDRRGEGFKKHDIPSLDDDVWRLKKNSKDGVFHEALKRSAIFSVKDFLRLYYKDEHSLLKILIKAPKLVWTTIIDHAKMCDPGQELYSLCGRQYCYAFLQHCLSYCWSNTGWPLHPVSDLDKPTQDLVRQWRKFAYDSIPHNLIMKWLLANQDLLPVYFPRTEHAGSQISRPYAIFAERNIHETGDQQGASGSHSMQHTLKRLGSVQVTQNDEDASFDISFFPGFWL